MEKRIMLLMVIAFLFTDVAAQRTVNAPVSDKRFFLNLQSGMGFRIGRINEGANEMGLSDIARQQRNGIMIDAEAGYMIGDDQSIGLRFSRFGSAASGTITVPGAGSFPFSVKESIAWIGPVYSYYQPLGQGSKSTFVGRLGAGLASYSGTFTSNGNDQKISKSTLSGLAGFNFNIHITNGFGFLIGADYSSGAVKIDNTEEKENVSLIRVLGGLQLRL